MNELSVSFCIACKNNLLQLEQTLRKNLDDNVIGKGTVEFVIVDFGSEDGLCNWVLEHFAPELKSGYLKYYHTLELSSWHESRTRNTACFCSSHDIIVSFDCNALTGYLGGLNVIRDFLRNPDMIYRYRFSSEKGHSSQLSILRKYFDLLGGYDESFAPVGYEDVDLVNRATQYGLKYMTNSPGNLEPIEFAVDSPRISRAGSFKNYNNMLENNRKVSDLNISECFLKANAGFYGVRKNIFDCHGVAKFQ